VKRSAVRTRRVEHESDDCRHGGDEKASNADRGTHRRTRDNARAEPEYEADSDEGGEMHGVHSRAEVAATATSSNRWRDLTMNDRHVLHDCEDFAIISYRAEVTRADGNPYAALVSSAYIRRPEGWKLAFHQHSPV
jgi:hypothetical protein